MKAYLNARNTHISQRKRSPTGQQTRLLVFTLIINLLVVAGAAFYLRETRQELETRAESDAETLTKLTAQNVESQLARIDLAMRIVASELQHRATPRLVESTAMTAFNASNGSNGMTGLVPVMRLIDENGFFVAGPGIEKGTHLNVQDRDYFQEIRDGQGTDVVVGGPATGKLDHTWMVPLARPLRAADGTLLGLVHVSVPIGLFHTQSPLSVYRDSLFLVMDSKFRAISRITKGEQQLKDIGRILPGISARHLIAAKGGFLPGTHIVSGVDGIERVHAVQALKGAPWYVTAGVPWSSYVSAWNQDLARTGVMVAFFIGLSCVLTWYLYRGMMQQLEDWGHIEFLAYHDVLTELPNRKLLKERFSQALKSAYRNHSKVALLYLDLDHFKAVNDSLGHAAGDILLKEIAKRIRTCVRESDVVSRQGGDEFLILLKDLTTADDATPVILKILEGLAPPLLLNGKELVTSASLGLAMYPDDGDDFDTLRKKADVAMYKAKDQGRNGYCFFDEAMNASAHERLELTNALTRALARKEFVLHYQPQVDLKTNTIVGVEALVRWNHPLFGMLQPTRFISLAEQSGLIVPLGTWVLEEACRTAVAWQRQGLPAVTMAVNLSAMQLKRSDFESTVKRVLQESGMPPSLLELELTESMLMNDTTEVLAAIQRLRETGVQLSIDDFGTGFSSLSYLKQFKADKLKIDQSFTQGMSVHSEDRAVIKAVIQLAHDLKFKTIAEGVETASQLECLIRLGCDETQGFYHAKPMSATEMVTFLQLPLQGQQALAA